MRQRGGTGYVERSNNQVLNPHNIKQAPHFLKCSACCFYAHAAYCTENISALTAVFTDLHTERTGGYNLAAAGSLLTFYISEPTGGYFSVYITQKNNIVERMAD